MKLKKDFFNRNTTVVARDLIGKVLVRKIGQKVIRARITETEAYHGPHDRASHAFRGVTDRTLVMFGNPGTIYVYLIYGMYNCLNIVTGPQGFPSAVLIRGIEGAGGNGPGKLCRLLNIDRSLNSRLLGVSSGLWIEDGQEPVSSRNIIRSKRIGVDYAGQWKDKLWRFTLRT